MLTCELHDRKDPSRISSGPTFGPERLNVQAAYRTRSEISGGPNMDPGGAHADEARSQAARLRQEAQESAAHQAEVSAWQNTDQNSKAALQDFLSRYESGPHAIQARELLARIAKQESDALAAQAEQRAKEEEANRLIADRLAIQRTLRDYEAAYNRRGLDALQKLWTLTSPQWREFLIEFADAKSVVYRLEPLETPHITNGSATVNCARKLQMTYKLGRPPPEIDDRVRVTLTRRGSGWIILSFD